MAVLPGLQIGSVSIIKIRSFLLDQLKHRGETLLMYDSGDNAKGIRLQLASFLATGARRVGATVTTQGRQTTAGGARTSAGPRRDILPNSITTATNDD